MHVLLTLSRLIDLCNEWVGKSVRWLVLAAVVISAGNAVMRKAFNVSSNAYLEVQWYLFAAVFMLAGGYVLLKNAHVRIDFVSSRLSRRSNAVIDILGILAFILPLSWLMIDLSWPLFMNAYASGEGSGNIGGLTRWPVLLLIPAGFALLLLQAVSELIKRLAFLTGHRAEPFSVEPPSSNRDAGPSAELAGSTPASPAAQTFAGRQP